MKKGILNTAIIGLVIAFFLSGCMEHRYYRDNNRHSDRYNQRHHRNEPGVDVRIHN